MHQRASSQFVQLLALLFGTHQAPTLIIAQCACDHGTTALCCGQPGDPCPPASKDVCPATKPKCTDYVYGKHMGFCASQKSGTAMCEQCIDSYEDGRHPAGDNLVSTVCNSPDDPCVGPVDTGSAAHKAACCALCAVTPTCESWIIATSGDPGCWVKTGGGGLLQNKDRGFGKVSEAYIATGCPATLSSWGSAVVSTLVGIGAAYLGTGILIGRRQRGGGRPALQQHPHWPRWQELGSLCTDGMAFARGGFVASRPTAASRQQKLLLGAEQGEVPPRSKRKGKDKSTNKRKNSGNNVSAQRSPKETRTSAPSEECSPPRPTENAGAPATRLQGTQAGGGGRWVHVPE